MAVCGKNGAICYWAHWTRVHAKCSNCEWMPLEGCHPERTLCATCFEVIMDQEYADKPLWSYPACGAQLCRIKTQNQALARSVSMALPSLSDAVHVCAPSSPPLLSGPPPGLSSCGAMFSRGGTSTMPTTLTASAGNLALVESMASLKQAVVNMTRKTDDIMVAIEHIKWTMTEKHRFQPLYW